MSIDLIIAAFMMFFVAEGLIKGAVREIFSIVAAAAAYFLSAGAASAAVSVFKYKGAHPVIAQTAAMLVFWTVFYLLIIIAGRLFEKKFLKSSGVKIANRVSGGILGAAKALLIALIVIWSVEVMFSLTGIKEPEIMKKSRVCSAAGRHNLLKRTKKYREVRKMLNDRKLMARLEALKESASSGAGLPGEFGNMDTGKLLKILKKSGAVKPDEMPKDLNIDSLTKMLKDMNSKNLNKLKSATR